MYYIKVSYCRTGYLDWDELELLYLRRIHLVFVLIFTQLAVKKYLPYVFKSLCKGVSDLGRYMDFFLFREEVVKI